MSSVGIDFGTSNCFAHLATAEHVLPIRLEGEHYALPSVVYAARREIAPRPVLETEVQRRLKSMRAELRRARTDPARRPDEAAMERMIRDGLRREALEAASQAYQDQTLLSAMEGGQHMVFGTEALRLHFADPSAGFLVKSPKSFLGSDMDARRVAAFEDIVTVMLRNIRAAAQCSSGSEIVQAVLGRPVRYQGIGGEQADAQAIAVMARAAARAGFTEVRFELEPLAAAYEYERAIQNEELVLVVDVGGGTTDCAMVRLSQERAGHADRSGDILGVSGDRVGGTDFDEALTWRALMPAFGKDALLRNGRALPHGILHDAISIRDVPAQARFARAAEEIGRLAQATEQAHLLHRLQSLHAHQLQHQLVHAAERAKISLSEQELVHCDLGFVEAGLILPVDRVVYGQSARHYIDRIRALAHEAMDQAGVRPDVVFMTGGMAISPVVSTAIADIAGRDTPIRSSEMLGTVGKGLGLCAQRTFERRA
jgi:hypothetical chaperone protein